MSSLLLATVALFVGSCSAFHAPSPVPHLRAFSASSFSASPARIATRIARRGGLDLSMAGVEREVLREGDGKTFPQKGDLLTVRFRSLARPHTSHPHAPNPRQANGSKRPVAETDRQQVHYEGTLARGGTKFDSSYDFGEPLQVTTNGGIERWRERERERETVLGPCPLNGGLC